MKMRATTLWIGVLSLVVLAGCHEKRDTVDAADGAADSSIPADDAGENDAAVDSVVPEDGGAPPLGDIGSVCSVNADCLSSSCVDGVCCSSAACGPCQSCATESPPGACSPLPPFTADPSSGCTGVSACDGTGLCLKTTGQSCKVGSDCVSGSCADGVCCGSACDQQCYSCNQPGSEGVCSPLNGVVDDVASVICSGANLCVIDPSGVPSCLVTDGQACSKDGDCASGRCRTYFFDGDRDGYGSAANAIQRCNATIAPPAGYVSVGGDCCDYDRGANPGVAAASYFAAADGCGNWDWNCSGIVEKQSQVGPCIGVAAGSTPSCGQDCNRYFLGHPFKVYTQTCH